MPLAGHGLRTTPLRRRASRPQLKRDPLGSRAAMTRASALLFLALLTCTKGERTGNVARDSVQSPDVPKDSVQSRAPEPAALGGPDSFSTGGPLDEIPSLLAGFDSQAEAARQQARAVAGTPTADSAFLNFRDRFLKVGEQITDRLDQATSIQSTVLEIGRAHV